MTASPSSVDAPAPSPPRRAARWWRVPLWLGLSGAVVVVLLRLLAPAVLLHYQDEVLAALGEHLELRLEAERLQLDWQGFWPQLSAEQVRVQTSAVQPALQLARLALRPSGIGWWRGELNFSQIDIEGARLHLVREPSGRIRLAGQLKELAAAEDGADLDWLLAQPAIRISDSALLWEDRLREAPPLLLEGLSLALLREAGQPAVTLEAPLPPALGHRLQLHAVLRAGSAREAGWQARVQRAEWALENMALAHWRPWLALPVGLLPAGDFTVRAQLASTAADTLTGTLELQAEAVSVDWALASTSGRARFAALGGRFAFSLADELLRVEAEELALTDVAAQALPLPARLTVELAPSAVPQGGRLAFDRFELASLPALAEALELPAGWRELLAGLAPQGRLTDTDLSWQPVPDASPRWQLATRLEDVGVQASAPWPGVQGLSARLAGDQDAGHYQLASEALTLDLPVHFTAGALALGRVEAEGSWQFENELRQLVLTRLQLDNEDFSGSAQGHYRQQADAPGEIELAAQLSRARGNAVWSYLPAVVGQQTQDWVREAVRSADVKAASLRLRGPLDDFPYRKGEGEFRVQLALENGRLVYDDDWPAIDNIVAELDFNGPGLNISASQANIFGVALDKVQVAIPELDTSRSDLMTINGKARGRTAEFLRFVAASPVSHHIDGMTDSMQAEGEGRLELQLKMPLNNPDATRVAGEFVFQNNRLRVLEALPMLERAGGRLQFTEHKLSIPQAQARFLGGEARLSAATAADGGLRFELAGEAEVAALEQLAGAVALPPVMARLQGRLPWTGSLALQGAAWQLALESSLQGVSLALPAPLSKAAAERWPLQLQLASGATGASRLQTSLTLPAGQPLAAVFEQQGEEAWRGALALGAATPPLPAQGVALRLALDELALEPWQALLDDGAFAVADGSAGLLPLQGELKLGRLQGLGQDFGAMQATFRLEQEGWQARLDSPRVAGELSWLDTGSGALRARFEHLLIGESKTAAASSGRAADERGTGEESDIARSLPALDIVVERLVLRDHELGRLQLNARNRSGLWLLDDFSLANEDAQVSGRGEWRTTGVPHCSLDFALEVNNIGRFSRRLGQDDVIRGGKASLSGELDWRGDPLHPHYPSLGGRLKLRAASGQFNKLEPGVGRLLGILSLQALPRRITLDFRDVFSAGFAFDGISGSMEIEQGVMRSKDFAINGPAARIRMQGWADLQAETQDLRVLVQPTLSESVALGAAATLVNPVAGVVTYLAQKALSDPIEKLFAYEYEISGSWSDPVVARVGRQPVAPVPALP